MRDMNAKGLTTVLSDGVDRVTSHTFAEKLELLITEIVRTSDSEDLTELPRLVDGELFEEVVAKSLGCEVANFYVYDEPEARLRFLHEAVQPGLQMPFFRITGREGPVFSSSRITDTEFEQRRRRQKEALAHGGEPLTASLCYDALLKGERRSIEEKAMDCLIIPEGEVVTFSFEYYLLRQLEHLPPSRLAEIGRCSRESLWSYIADASLGIKAWRAIFAEAMHDRSLTAFQTMIEWLSTILADRDHLPTEQNYPYFWNPSDGNRRLNWFVCGASDLRSICEHTDEPVPTEERLTDLATLVVWYGLLEHSDQSLNLSLDRFYRLSRLSPPLETLHGTRNIVAFLVGSPFLSDTPMREDPIKALLLGTFYDLDTLGKYLQQIKTLYRLLSHRDHTRFAIFRYKKLVQRLRTTEEIMATLSGSGFVHELRRPLGSIRMAVQLLEKNKNEPDFDVYLQRYLSRIDSSVGRVMRMIEVFISIASVSRPLERHPINLAGLVRSVVRTMQTEEIPDSRGQAEKALPDGVTLNEQYPSRPMWVFVNDLAIELVIQNLLRNAVEAMQGTGRIAISVINSGDKVLVTIGDTGPGVPESVRHQLFKLFTTTKAKKEGMGLGLYLCRHLLSLQDAEIALDDDYRDGALFTLTFPCFQS
jgi:signal transduction histidine kinase